MKPKWSTWRIPCRDIARYLSNRSWSHKIHRYFSVGTKQFPTCEQKEISLKLFSIATFLVSGLTKKICDLPTWNPNGAIQLRKSEYVCVCACVLTGLQCVVCVSLILWVWYSSCGLWWGLRHDRNSKINIIHHKSHSPSPRLKQFMSKKCYNNMKS